MAYGDEQLCAARQYLHDNAALREAVGAAPDAELEPCYLGVGEHNLNYRFTEPASGSAFVLRINVVMQPFHDNQVAYEFGALRALQPSGRTPQPLYVDDSETAPGKGALVIGFCEGDELDFDHLRPGDLQCAAQIMADVHAVPVPASCSIYQPADPLLNLYEECLQRFAAYRASVFEEERLTRWVESFIEVAEPVAHGGVRSHSRAHIVNTEPLPSHFLIPAESAVQAAARRQSGGRFCANPGSFVDWERPIVGEVAQDVAYFVSPTTTFWDSEFLMTADEAHAFVEDYWRAVDGRFERGDFDKRFNAFRMMTALRSVTWFCKALSAYGKGGLGHTTEKTARKFPRYLSDDFMQLLARDCFGMKL